MADTWFVMEEIANSHPWLSVDAKIECVDVYQHGIRSGTVKQMVVKGEGDTDQLCFIRSEFNLTAQAILEKILSNIDWALSLSERIIQQSQALIQLSRAILALEPRQLTDEQLAVQIEQWAALRRKTHGLGMLWNYVEFENQLFSGYLTNYLTERIAARGLPLIPAKVFATLAQPRERSFAQREAGALLQLAIDAGGRRFTPAALASRLAAHTREYCWLPYMYLGPAWSEEHFRERLEELLTKNLAERKNILITEQQQPAQVAAEQARLLELLGSDDLHRQYFRLAQSFVYTKSYRKDATYYGFYCLERSFAEAARRLGLTRTQFRMLMSWEAGEAIRTGTADVNELNRRFEYRAVHYDGKTKTVLSGAAAREWFSRLAFEQAATSLVNELKGSCACPGTARGLVKIINTAAEMEKMRAGDVLVSRATSPDIVAAMRQAVAIVTDMGGITCHAAIVSRELGIPCVIGTKIATQALRDGDLVEVDATAGVVNKIN